MDRFFEANGVAAAPAAPTKTNGTYPTGGDPVAGIPASTPGAWWYHLVTEELRNAAIAVGQTPDFTKTNQLGTGLASMAKCLPLTGGTLSGDVSIASPAPALNFSETDQTGAAGLWKIVADASTWFFRKNTAAARDFSTYNDVFSVSNADVVTFSFVPMAPTRPVGDNTTRLATTQYVQQNTLGGAAQSWTDVTASRALSTIYTNTTGRPISVSIKISGANPQAGPPMMEGVVNGLSVAEAFIPYGSSPMKQNLVFIVPNGATYKAYIAAQGTGISIDAWRELR
jgi:hypothetical protein